MNLGIKPCQAEMAGFIFTILIDLWFLCGECLAERISTTPGHPPMERCLEYYSGQVNITQAKCLGRKLTCYCACGIISSLDCCPGYFTNESNEILNDTENDASHRQKSTKSDNQNFCILFRIYGCFENGKQLCTENSLKTLRVHLKNKESVRSDFKQGIRSVFLSDNCKLKRTITDSFCKLPPVEVIQVSGNIKNVISVIEEEYVCECEDVSLPLEIRTVTETTLENFGPNTTQRDPYRQTTPSSNETNNSAVSAGFAITTGVIIITVIVSLLFANRCKQKTKRDNYSQDAEKSVGDNLLAKKDTNLESEDTIRSHNKNNAIQLNPENNAITLSRLGHVWRSKQDLVLLDKIQGRQNKPLLGSGYFAQVFLAQSTTNGNTVAIKRIDLFKTLCHYSSDEDDHHEDDRLTSETNQLSKLSREAENLSQINSENVIKLQRWWIEDPGGRVIDIQELNDSLSVCPSLSSSSEYWIFLQMEYCHGDLSSWLKQFLTIEERQREESLKSMFLQIVSGLAAIHSRNIIHRDLKPDNILYSLNGTLKTWKIGDFGLSRQLESLDSPHGFLSVAGAPHYKSPEMENASSHRGRRGYGPKTDIFSLALTLLEVLHPMNSYLEKHKCFDKLRRVRAGVTEITFSTLEDNNLGLVKLIKNMLKIDVDDRWDILHALQYLQELIRSQK